MDFTEAYSDRCSAVGLAAREGDVKCLKKLIRQGYSIDVPDNRGWMPIHEAAFHNTSKCLKHLICAAPSDNYIRSKTFEGTCSLHLSASRGSLECAALLLESGADPNELTNDATTPLFLAVENGHTDVIKLLLQHGANINGSHCWSEWNSLHQAAFQRYPEILKLLLDHGANIESVDDFGITPLFVAAQYGKLECLRILISYGANVNCQATDRATPLFIAAQEGNDRCVELLLSSGADPNLYCNEEEWQLPVHAAAQMGHSNWMVMQLQKNSWLLPDVFADISKYGRVMKEKEAINFPSFSLVAWAPLLTSAKASGDRQELCLNSVTLCWGKSILKMLISVTDQFCGSAEGKVSPVYSAIYGDHTDCLELLLKEGYSPGAQPCPVFGCRSPMALAIQKGFGLIPLLLKYGITPLETDLSYCLHQEKFSLFQHFLKRGCKFPSGQHLAEFSKCAINAGGKYREWLPSLLLAGFNPVNPLCKPWLCSLEKDVLNFLLEFTNWKRLPPDVEQILSVRKGTSTWVPHRHFECIPSLSHLCRLEIRSLLTSDRLRSDQFVHQLPLPDCLQNFLLYSDILHTYDISEHWLKLWEVYGENPSQSSSSLDNQREEECQTDARRLLRC